MFSYLARPLARLYNRRMTSLPITIAVDGPSAGGKGTIAKKLAAALDFAYLDTGALYRAVGLIVLRKGWDLADPQAAIRAAHELKPEAMPAFVNDPELRAENTSRAASFVSAVPEVRTILLKFQQDFCARPPLGKKGAVLDGRDIGTVIAPDAILKLYVTADAKARATRRYKELIQRGETVTESAVLADMQARDKRDAERAVAPAKSAADAVLLDTTALTAEEAFEAALQLARFRIEKI